MKNGKVVFPLTIRDAYSRCILEVAALPGTGFEYSKERFEACFRRYGLPEFIRTDNGGPFASTSSVGGLSRLSAWWIKQGVFPERIDLASPYQNGAHERMHKDMKQELQQKPLYNLKDEQKRFDEWVYDYNNIRPHRSLGMLTPGARYACSEREYDPKKPDFEYQDEMITRRVSRRGFIFWHSERKFLSGSLEKETVGIRQEDDDTLSVWYCDYPLGCTSLNFDTPLGGYQRREA